MGEDAVMAKFPILQILAACPETLSYRNEVLAIRFTFVAQESLVVTSLVCVDLLALQCVASSTPVPFSGVSSTNVGSLETGDRGGVFCGKHERVSWQKWAVFRPASDAKPATCCWVGWLLLSALR